MKFTEALEQKKLYGEQIIEDGKVLDILIVPSKFPDQLQYLKWLIKNPYSDVAAIPFSTDNEFNLYAQWTKETQFRLLKR